MESTMRTSHARSIRKKNNQTNKIKKMSRRNVYQESLLVLIVIRYVKCK